MTETKLKGEDLKTPLPLGLSSKAGPHVRDAKKPAPNKAVHLNASARIVTSAT